MPRLARFEDLDDGCLLEVQKVCSCLVVVVLSALYLSAALRLAVSAQVLKHLTPLPDLFSATRVCRVRPACALCYNSTPACFILLPRAIVCPATALWLDQLGIYRAV